MYNLDIYRDIDIRMQYEHVNKCLTCRFFVNKDPLLTGPLDGSRQQTEPYE